MSHYLINIDYDEFDQFSYRAIEVYLPGGLVIIKRFDTGDFLVDWRALQHWALHEDNDLPELYLSSSVDHFFMDGDKYEWEWE